MGKTLDDLFKDPSEAEAMISLLKETAAKAVQRDIKAHEQVWQKKIPDEKDAALARATTWATRQAGHRVKCPACGSPSLVQGSPQGTVTTKVVEDQIVQTQGMLPSSFECVACDLRISGLSRLTACGLGDAFTATSSYWAADYFMLYTEQDLAEARAEIPEPEEDFNEY